MTESATKNMTSSSSSVTSDWSLLPEELLQIISEKVEDCFDIIHARSVCSSWRSTFPVPCILSRERYSLPSFANFPNESKDLCTFEKIPLFLFTVQTPPPASASDYFLGGIGLDEDQTQLSSPIQCSLKVKIPGSDPTLVNLRDCQILPLGHQYRMIGCDSRYCRGLAFLPLNKEGREEFIVLLGFSRFLLLLRSSEMKWKPALDLERVEIHIVCHDIVTFKRRFYATGRYKTTISSLVLTLRIDPFSFQVNSILPAKSCSLKYLVTCGNDEELFLVEKENYCSDELKLTQFSCRVSRLQEEPDHWVKVSDLGDRVLFIGRFGNVSCSAKDFPDGCGVSGNTVLFTNELDNGTYAYKYGVDDTRRDELGGRNGWRFSGENRVTIRSTSPVVAFRVEH
ncbi:unnamed protein product [Eruca vesicaria subsp. sativa]|uniref:DUF295 domain-containing protein n=1 Tax=Eruca vesicaria subsp. sativa TaxID=29727 RepID=A0ABC8L7C9_ERUVS|nr:unnamed protein product [Eruca vesicaria subsp. sativa]